MSKRATRRKRREKLAMKPRNSVKKCASYLRKLRGQIVIASLSDHDYAPATISLLKERYADVRGRMLRICEDRRIKVPELPE